MKSVSDSGSMFRNKLFNDLLFFVDNFVKKNASSFVESRELRSMSKVLNPLVSLFVF